MSYSRVLQSRPIGDESEIRGSASSSNHDIYMSIEPSHLVTASGNKNLSKYFGRGKSMDQAGKIDILRKTIPRLFPK